MGKTDLATGQITGTYSVIGGTCDQIGTATLVPSFKCMWDYRASSTQVFDSSDSHMLALSKHGSITPLPVCPIDEC
jgi:hypothetical protein